MRSNLERQNRELREKLEENEEFGKGKSRAMLGALEAKVHALEEQLDGEVRFVKTLVVLFHFDFCSLFLFFVLVKNKRSVELFERWKNVSVTPQL